MKGLHINKFLEVIKTKAIYIFLTPLFLILLWANLQIALSIVANGFFYHIYSPVQVTDVLTDSAVLHFTRVSKVDVEGTEICELSCDKQVFVIPTTSLYLEPGCASFYKALPIPDAASGTCHYECLVSYAPFGSFGATLTHSFYSAEFIVTR